MKCFLLFLLFICSNAVHILNPDECRPEQIGPMDFLVCTGLEEYKKIYFEDATGVNQITFIKNKLYRNRGYYTAYSSENELYVAQKLYKKEEWLQFKNKFK